VLCEDVPGPAALEAVVAELRRALAAPLVVSGHEVYPAGSIGVAVASGDDDSPERLLREADEAMYQAKAARRSTATYDAAGQEDAARHALRTEAELHRALRHGELELHYQPQVGLTPRRPLRGLEALVRWRHPEHGLIGPDAFLATAEDTGLIRRLGAWVLDEACGQLAAWRALGLTDAHIPVTVNLSPRQLDDEALGNLVRAALVTHGLEPGALCLEITESSLLEEGSEAIARLEDLKALGVRIAVDDFGTGWSSLANLGRVPVDALKIDRVFVRAMETDDAARRIVAAVLGVARSMGLEAIAEGVETPSLAHALAGMGCATAQGHAFAPAAKAAEIEALLAAEAEARDARGPLRVFLCDDAPSLRRLLRSYLEAEPDLRVVGEAADGAHLTERVREAGADCVVLDLSMPRVDGLEALAELRANDPDIAIVVLSGFEARHMEAQVLALGADRYVAKRAGMRDVRAVIRDVVAARRGPASVLEGLA
jgi:EAL domain-containing protein (putative c-di-GMP-specific phosphodiesterase class I)/ActR/RegA family two-component response regulator